jgi:hypothetical protein
LDAACAEAGWFPQAIAANERTQEQAKASGQADLLQAAEQRLELYKAGKAFHENR